MKINRKKIYLFLLLITSVLIVFFIFGDDNLVKKNEKVDSFIKLKSILVSLKNLSEDKINNDEIINNELKKLTFFKEKNIDKNSIIFEDKSILSINNIVVNDGFIFYNLEFKNNNENDCFFILNNKNILENSLKVKIKNKKTSNYILLKNDFIDELSDKKMINNFCKNEEVEFIIAKKDFLVN